jgi:hypothetical protein
LRQQLLIGESHLLQLIGTDIEAIEFRRSASTETFTGGAVQMSVTLSTSPTPVLDCSRSFANNVGGGALPVFSGTVVIPTSPGLTGTTVTWTANNVVRIEFSTAFPYSGGTLCIDITGTPIVGQEPGWWMADAHNQGQSGTITDLGGSCGAFGVTSFRSDVRPGTLVTGGSVSMIARGTPGGLGIVVIGPKYVPGAPLAALGFPNAPANCALHVSQIDLLDARFFLPHPDPNLAVMGAQAEFELKIPAIPSALGFSMTTQWFDWTQSATSNAVEWVISPAMPSLDMALIEGHPAESAGGMTVNHAHVIRLEYM